MRVLIVQRSLSPPGGGNAVAAWMVQALSRQHDVSTLTGSGWSAASTNAFYGTAIDPSRVRRHVIPAPYRWLSALREGQMTRLRLSTVLHFARRLADNYDLLISADDFAPFASPGIQYVHFPARLQPPAARFKPIVDVYFRICNRLVGAPWSDATRNITLVNSRWTAEMLERLGELSNPTVLYPPVLDPGEGLPWHEREDQFLCVGRFHESKRIETSISIVKKVRQTVLPRARLIVVGSPVDPAYTSRLRAIASREGDWVRVSENLTRDELNTVMGRSRYGIQAMEAEHFGMATAEMTRAGCLVFAHNSGGSPEVLNHEIGLLWSTEESAVEKIAAITAGPAAGLSATLRRHAGMFSPAMFEERFRKIVEAVHVN